MREYHFADNVRSYSCWFGRCRSALQARLIGFADDVRSYNGNWAYGLGTNAQFPSTFWSYGGRQTFGCGIGRGSGNGCLNAE